MNRILFMMELRRNSRSLVTWSLVIGALVFFTMSFFRTVLHYQEQIAGMIQIVPVAVLKMRGFSNLEDIFSVLGFYSANNIIYMMLLGSIYSIVLGSNIIMKEEYEKTAEFLFSRPVNRYQIFFSKAALVFLYIFILNLISAVISFIALEIFKIGVFPVRPFLVLTLYTLLLNLLFGSVGFFIAVIMKRVRPVTFLTVGLVLVCYFIYSISGIAGVNGSFGYLSPFKWLNVEVLSPSYGPEFWRIGSFVGTVVLFTLVSAFIYRRKDILT